MHSGAISNALGHLQVFRSENILLQSERMDLSNATFLILNVWEANKIFQYNFLEGHNTWENEVATLATEPQKQKF